ncbi:MAG: right-handed parallel beta-helix repeat-containing protein [Lentisphaerae bacterium]|nr:right-handed parallel beta-helix repeat-containing protein [Lentisphaerota bacterium]
MKKFFVFFLSVAGIILSGVETVKVSSFGFDAKDSTRFLQKAIDSGARQVIVDNVGKPWITDSLVLRSDLELILADGVVLKALPGSFHHKTAFLFKLDELKNVVIRGQGKAVIEMNKKDYQNSKVYQWSEWRHAISLRGCHNVRIENLTVKSSGGDGIYVGHSKGPSRNILIDKVICEDHHRQGISVISVDGLIIRNSAFNSTGGTPPQSGIDIEPNHFTNSVRNILVENCEFNNNTSAGFMIHLGGPDKVSDITIRNCRMLNNRVGFQAYTGGRAGSVPCRISVENCLLADNKENAVVLYNQWENGNKILFRNTVFDHRTGNGVPVVLDNGRVSSNVTGVQFEKVKVIPKRRDIMEYVGKTGFGVTGISGDITIVRGKKSEKFDFEKFKKNNKPQGEVLNFKSAALDLKKVKAVKSVQTPVQHGVKFRGKQIKYIFCASQVGTYPVKFKVSPVGKSNLDTRVVFYDKAGNVMESLRSKEREFTHILKIRTPGVYLCTINTGRHGVSVSSELPGGAVAQDRLPMVHGSNFKLYFYVPAGVKGFSVEVAASRTEYVTVAILDPAGKKAAGKEKINNTAALEVKVPDSAKGGVWAVNIRNAVEDYQLRLSAPLTPVLSPSPEYVVTE